MKTCYFYVYRGKDMPIELGIWRINDGLEKVQFSSIDSEKKLEATLCRDISILDSGLMVVGNQVYTAYGKAIDILAINADCDLIIIELKRNRTPREVVAQILDYASWVESVTYEQVIKIYTENHKGKKFDEAYANKFGIDMPERFNEKHRLIVTASELDNSTERIINYLVEYGVPINAVFFRYFKDGKNEYIARSWLIDPDIAEQQASKAPLKRGGQEIWNLKDWYVSLGVDESRTWEDCQKYGFISAGGGKWYSNSLKLLPVGARVFVCVPKNGYIGVGIVKDTAVPVHEFKVVVDGIEKPILSLPLKATKMGEYVDDPDKSEYLVRVDWIKRVDLVKAVWEKGMFANQNSACKLRDDFTINRLTKIFELSNE
jgi:hypothetical protein